MKPISLIKELIRIIACLIYILTLGPLIFLFKIIDVIFELTRLRKLSLGVQWLFSHLVYYAYLAFTCLLEIDVIIEKPPGLNLKEKSSIFLHTHSSIIDNSGIFRIVEGITFSYLAKAELFKIPIFG